MKLTVRILACALAVVTPFATAARAETPRDALLVSTAWLAQHLNDPDLVLFHVGPDAEYPAAHIPGARFLAIRSIAKSDQGAGTLTLEMPPADALRAQLEAVGISDGSRVVVYGAKDWMSPPTRAVLTFLHAGLNVSLLDGGLEAWKKEGREVTSVVPPAKTGKLSPLKTVPIVVDAPFVQSHANTAGFAVVDARDAVFYDGSREGGPADRRTAGHIPGAHSVPFSNVTSEDMKLKPANELAAVFEKAGVKPQDTVIAYCHIGQQATAVLFAARTLGHSILLYDGSFEDWARRGLPVDNPAKK